MVPLKNCSPVAPVPPPTSNEPNIVSVEVSRLNWQNGEFETPPLTVLKLCSGLFVGSKNPTLRKSRKFVGPAPDSEMIVGAVVSS